MTIVRNFLYGVSFIVSTTAFVNISEAAPQHNCAAYAAAAVAQNEQNKAVGCGLTGGRWQSDYDAHFTWCQQQNVGIQDLSSEDHARKVELQACSAKTAFCESYAKGAVGAQIENMQYQCKFGGGRWQLNHSAHFKWCMGVQQTSTVAENEERANALLKCKQPKNLKDDLKLNPVSE